MQATPWLRPAGRAPGSANRSRFRCRHRLSMRQQWFNHVRLLVAHLTRVRGPSPQRSPPRLLTDAACGGLGSPPARRTRRTYLHHWHSTARVNDLLHRHHSPSGHTLARPLMVHDRASSCRVQMIGKSRPPPRQPGRSRDTATGLRRLTLRLHMGQFGADRPNGARASNALDPRNAPGPAATGRSM